MKDTAVIAPAVARAADYAALRAYRLGCMREQLAQRDYAACLLFDSINIRCATDARYMQV